MPELTFQGKTYAFEAGETVLDTLLRHGLPAAHSCKAGSCGSCMLRAPAGAVPASAQTGLKDSWKAQGYFLPCVCRVESNLSISPVGADAQLSGTIRSLELLSPDVLRLRVRCDAPLPFRGGQYVTLLREDGLARSYSIASLPDEGELEFHVRRIAQGRMSGWLHEEAGPGDRVSVLGPSGECFYVPGNPDQPLLLVGTGTGLAPLYGILRDAIANQHRGPIQLFHGAVHKGGLYLVNELRRLAAAHAHVDYSAAVLQGEESEDCLVGPLDKVVLSRIPKLTGWRGYVCGDPALVGLLKKKFFLSGMASREIHADAFLASVV